MRYGVPYTGSKNKIAAWVVDNLPPARFFIDAFAGGCAVTHAALLSGKYERLIANDLSPAPDLFLDAVHGKFKDETRWISREEFHALKATDAYVRYCWSFGNNGRNYIYGDDIVPYKKACHYAVMLDDWKLFREIYSPQMEDEWRERLSKETGNAARRQALRKIMILQHLQYLERLNEMQEIKSAENFSVSQSDYRNLFIPRNSVIYCDPPYHGADCRYGYTVDGTGAPYGRGVDYEPFYQWCEKQKDLVIISEYGMPEKRFVSVASRGKRCTMSQTVNALAIEHLYVPKHQEALYYEMMGKAPAAEFYKRMGAIE